MKIGELKRKIIFLQVVIVVMAIFLMMMGVSIKLQSDTLAEWNHVIEFLKIWIKQNDLQIVPTDQI